jgi:transposase
MRTSQKTPETITTIGIDLGKNTFHLVGLDKRGAIVLQLKVSRGHPSPTGAMNNRGES